MANWFKLYETDLDESRLRYALNKIPEAGWVWIGILSECCKHRSDTIRWSNKSHELFGFSDRLKVSIPKVNESLLMLAEIEYIELGDGSIKVLKWNEKQSEYNHRKARGDYHVIGDSPILSAKSVKSPLEERRGEEIRGEEKRREENTKPVASLLRVASKEKEAAEVYEAYPKKVGKPAALKAILKAISKTDFPELLKKTKLFAACRNGQDNAFTPHPATWFNQERYNDDPATWKSEPQQSQPEFRRGGQNSPVGSSIAPNPIRYGNSIN